MKDEFSLFTFKICVFIMGCVYIYIYIYTHTHTHTQTAQLYKNMRENET